MPKFSLRPATSGDGHFLEDMLVAAVNWPADRNWSRDRVLQNPSFSRYLVEWMRPGDFGLVAVDSTDVPIGASWYRFLGPDEPGHGYLARDIPELTLAVVEEWRGRGVGKALIRALMSEARARGLTALSLSVERANSAHDLYVDAGFRVVESIDDADTMLADLTDFGASDPKPVG